MLSEEGWLSCCCATVKCGVKLCARAESLKSMGTCRYGCTGVVARMGRLYMRGREVGCRAVKTMLKASERDRSNIRCCCLDVKCCQPHISAQGNLVLKFLGHQLGLGRRSGSGKNQWVALGWTQRKLTFFDDQSLSKIILHSSVVTLFDKWVADASSAVHYETCCNNVVDCIILYGRQNFTT